MGNNGAIRSPLKCKDISGLNSIFCIFNSHASDDDFSSMIWFLGVVVHQLMASKSLCAIYKKIKILM
jgi:hypothetical protein